MERRALERFDLKIPAKIRIMNQLEDKENPKARTRDICAQGAFFHTSKPLPEATKVKIDMILPLHKLRAVKDAGKQVSLKLSGRVLRSESTGMAVSFNGDYRFRPCERKPD